MEKGVEAVLLGVHAEVDVVFAAFGVVARGLHLDIDTVGEVVAVDIARLEMAVPRLEMRQVGFEAEAVVVIIV